MAERHVAQGETHVARQREIVRELRDRDHDSAMAETLLAEFESTLRDHVAHRHRLLAERVRD